MPSTETFILQVHSFNSIESITTYKNALVQLNCDSAYYCYELLNGGQDETQKLHFFIFKSNDGSIMAVMPFIFRKIIIGEKDTGYFDVSSPWGYNGPYFKHGISEDLQQDFWEAVDSWYSQNNVVSEFLRFNFFEHYKNYTGTVIHTLLNVKGAIDHWDTFWANLKSNTRNQFRKADKLGLTFTLMQKDISEDTIQDFYTVYIGTMDRRDARDSFYHPLDYFINFWKNNPDKCAIGLVYLEGKPISSELFLISDNTLFSFLGGTDADHFKLRPNEYLKINAVKWANEKGLKYYMIGGGLSNGTEDNLYLYKKKYFPYDDDIDFYTGRKIILMDKYKEFTKTAGIDFVSSGSAENSSEGFFPKYREASRV